MNVYSYVASTHNMYVCIRKKLPENNFISECLKFTIHYVLHTFLAFMYMNVHVCMSCTIHSKVASKVLQHVCTVQHVYGFSKTVIRF